MFTAFILLQLIILNMFVYSIHIIIYNPFRKHQIYSVEDTKTNISIQTLVYVNMLNFSSCFYVYAFKIII